MKLKIQCMFQNKERWIQFKDRFNNDKYNVTEALVIKSTFLNSRYDNEKRKELTKI